MKTLQLEKTPLSFRRAARLARKGLLVLTEKGKPAFALVGVKDEMALEVLALRRNAEFMAYLEGISRRAKRGRTFTLREIREEFGVRPKARRRRSART